MRKHCGHDGAMVNSGDGFARCVHCAADRIAALERERDEAFEKGRRKGIEEAWEAVAAVKKEHEVHDDLPASCGAHDAGVAIRRLLEGDSP